MPIFNCKYLVEIDPSDTSQNVRQGIHDIGGSIGDKRLVNFIGDAVKRGQKYAEHNDEF